MVSFIDKDAETVLISLRANGFSPVQFVEKAADAANLLLQMIPSEATIGITGSATIRQIGIITQLKARGMAVVDVTAPSQFAFDELLRQSLLSDILLASSNAVTLDGKLVNIDAYGNRVAGMIFGPKKVILVISKNKFVRDVNEAIDRIKNVIAPYHARARGSRTPCSVDLQCTGCDSPERICNVTMIIEKKPQFTEISIILVGEDLGLGWHPDWPKERKERIAASYLESRKGHSKAVQHIHPQKS